MAKKRIAETIPDEREVPKRSHAEMVEREEESQRGIAETFKLAGLLFDKLDRGEVNDFMDMMRNVEPYNLIEVMTDTMLRSEDRDEREGYR